MRVGSGEHSLATGRERRYRTFGKISQYASYL